MDPTAYKCNHRRTVNYSFKYTWKVSKKKIAAANANGRVKYSDKVGQRGIFSPTILKSEIIDFGIEADKNALGHTCNNNAKNDQNAPSYIGDYLLKNCTHMHTHTHIRTNTHTTAILYLKIEAESWLKR